MPGQPRDVSGSPGRPPIPSTPSTTRSAAVDRRRLGRPAQISELDQPAAGGAQRGEAALVRRAEAADRGDPSPAAREPGAGEQRVAAVVARADQDQHPARRRRCPLSRSSSRIAIAARPPAARCIKVSSPDLLDGPLFQRADGGDVVRVLMSTQASQTTTAEAIPASWERRDVDRRDPQLAGARGHRAGDLERTAGRWSSVTHSASCQDIPVGAPSALASASLAANRAAWEATGRSASAGGEQPLDQPGRRSDGLGEPGHVADVDAHPDDHDCHSQRARCRPGPARPSDRPGGALDTRTADHSTVTDLARLRGWSTSWPFRVASSQAKTCSGTWRPAAAAGSRPSAAGS